MEENINAQLVDDTSLEMEMILKVNVGIYKTLNRVMVAERFTILEWVAWTWWPLGSFITTGLMCS